MRRDAIRIGPARPLLGAFAFTLWVAAGLAGHAEAQPAATPSARAATPPDQDLTGYWVAVVTEQWHLRMRVPPKGEFSMLPLNAAAREVAAAWNPAADRAAHRECGHYGAPVIMRVPGRLHIHWADDETLELDTDSGEQRRLLHFAAAAAAEQPPPSWQGHSLAAWQTVRDGRYLTVTTTRLLPGYLRRNGAPYSAQTELEEHFYTFEEPNGDRWLVVTSIVTDPTYLTRPYTTTNHFKRVTGRSAWDPTPCRADRPR